MQINIVLLSFQHIFVGHFQRALQDIIKLKLGKLNIFERMRRSLGTIMKKPGRVA